MEITFTQASSILTKQRGALRHKLEIWPQRPSSSFSAYTTAGWVACSVCGGGISLGGVVDFGPYFVKPETIGTPISLCLFEILRVNDRETLGQR